MQAQANDFITLKYEGQELGSFNGKHIAGMSQADFIKSPMAQAAFPAPAFSDEARNLRLTALYQTAVDKFGSKAADKLAEKPKP